MAVNQINSSKDPEGWHTRQAVLFAQSTLLERGWVLCWNARTSSKFVDCLAEMALVGNCNILYSSFNLGSIPKVLCDIYVTDLVNYCPL